MSQRRREIISHSFNEDPEVRGGLLAAVLMVALAIPLLYLTQALAPALAVRLEVLLMPGGLLLGTALGGAIALRIVPVQWRTLVIAALAASVMIMLYVEWQIPAMAPGGVGEYPGAWLDVLKNAALLVVVGAAGVLALPLVDPLVRRQGPSPNVLHVAGAALAVTLIVLLVERYVIMQSDVFFGLTTLIVGAIGAVVLAALALLLSLLGRQSLGGWLGGVALLLWLFGAAAWYAAGHPWFP